MNKDVASAQAETLTTWADQWGRDQAEGSNEVAFLLGRAAKMMRGEAGADPETLPPAPVQSEVARD